MVRDAGSSSGTFLNKLRLAPSGKDSKPFPLKEGDMLQFGVDYKGMYHLLLIKTFTRVFLSELDSMTNLGFIWLKRGQTLRSIHLH